MIDGLAGGGVGNANGYADERFIYGGESLWLRSSINREWLQVHRIDDDPGYC